ncbi:MAG: hypothetical protein ACRCTQ_06875 [Brevinemataceae bacterium]
MKKTISIVGIIFLFSVAQKNFAQMDIQSFEQTNINFESTNTVTTNLVLSNNQPVISFGITNNPTNTFFYNYPKGIVSLISTPSAVDEVQSGYVTMYFPKGYGYNNQHFGIWNAIPFIVFDNNSLQVRFGLIFEHRQVGFVPDSWMSTSITGRGTPEISFLIPQTKTFLNFIYGASQWRASVLLTEDQISNLAAYSVDLPASPSDPYANTFTVTHRMVDGSSFPYLLGPRNKSYFKMMLQFYDFITKNPQVKKFQGSDKLPAGSFFDGVVPQAEASVSNTAAEDTATTETAPTEGVEIAPTEDSTEEDETTLTEDAGDAYAEEQYYYE